MVKSCVLWKRPVLVHDISCWTWSSEFNGRRLRETWMQTWSANNGILLLSHLHEAFNSRLTSIHPDTLAIWGSCYWE
ncbi:hypothetical protein DER45DRAFT_577596 [Fusarium avenaceum]|nr:hypothetical protein DER45DRAFT_577596 [Fusarium avenaceum]